jgi:hypothetical protein
MSERKLRIHPRRTLHGYGLARGTPISPELRGTPHIAQPLQTRCFKEALARLRDLFVDSPGVMLTSADVAQMAGLDRQVCRILLRTLIDTGFLEQRVRGTFVRRSPNSHLP